MLFVSPFLLFLYWELAGHVLWRDEINVWGLVTQSHSVAEVLSRVRYEGHPAFWYLLCYGASLISHQLVMMKLVQAAVATAIVLVLAFTGPFRRFELALILLGYYLSFQYTVMARMYGLEVLFALLYAWSRVRFPERQWLNALWLGLVANQDVTGMLLATVLMAEYVWDRWHVAKRAGEDALKAVLPGVAVYTGLVLVSVMSLWPTKDIGWASTGPVFAHFSDPEHFGNAFAKWAGVGWFPSTTDVIAHWEEVQPWPHAFLVPLALAALIAFYWRKPRYAATYAGVAVVGMMFSHATHVGALRHVGIIYIAFLVTLWMMRSRGERVSPAVYVLHGFMVYATIANVVQQWGRPFADDRDAARWLASNKLEDMPMLGTPDTNVIGVTERLGRPMYQLECACWDNVLTFAKRRDAFDPKTDIPSRTIQGMDRLAGQDALLLTIAPLSKKEQGQLTSGAVQTEMVASFDRGVVADEHIYIYRLSHNELRDVAKGPASPSYVDKKQATAAESDRGDDSQL